MLSFFSFQPKRKNKIQCSKQLHVKARFAKENNPIFIFYMKTNNGVIFL